MPPRSDLLFLTFLFCFTLTCIGLAGPAGGNDTAPATGSPLPAAVVYDRIISAALADSYAYERLQELCDTIGPRLCGSPHMESAIAWAVEVMQRDGFDRVWTEPFTVPHWVRGEEWAEVTAPTPFKLTLIGLGRSVGTPSAGIEAEVLAVKDFAELRARAGEAAGKIVLFNPPWEGYGKTVRYRVDGASAAAEHGAVACLIRSVTDYSLGAPHTGVMAYADSVPKIPAAALTVEDAGRLYRLAQRGLRPRVRLYMEAQILPDTETANVLGEIRGREKPAEIVLIAGHLDSWDTGTGAHDDGAGSVIALAAARLLKSLDLIPRRTVRVVLYGCEEYGRVAGDAYLDTHVNEIDRHVAAIESDSGGFAPRGFSVRSDSLVLARVAQLARPLAVVGGDSVWSGWSGVDIHPVVERGVPGIGHRTRSEDYFHYHHSPADTFDKIDPSALARNVAAVAALLYAIADDPVPLRDLAGVQ